MSNTIRISRERKELLAKYAEAACNLYGVISTDELTEVFNHYEDEKTNAEELRLGLQRLLKADVDEEYEFSLYEDLIFGCEFLPEFDEDVDDIINIRSQQSGKPRYLPDKSEFLRYTDSNYFEPQKPYDDLKAYIVKNKLTKKPANTIGDDLIGLCACIKSCNMNLNEELEFFQESGYELGGIKAINAFLQQIANVHNNTRLYENNGYTPNEGRKAFASMHPAPGTMIKPPFEENEDELFSKVGRNDPCPCGSGLKFKKCHGSQDAPKNKLSASDTEHFYRLWYGVLAYVNKKYNLVPNVQRDLDRNNYKTIDASKIKRARDKVWEEPELITEYVVNDGAKLSDADRKILLDWQENHIQSRFMLVKHLKDYSAFMLFEEGKSSTLYGVVGLLNSVERMFPRERMPTTVEAVLLPFKGRIVHDTLIANYGISYQSGAKSAFDGFYDEEFAKNGITTAIGNE